MSDAEHPTRASEAFFGRRKGKPLRERQVQHLETLLPELKVDLSTEAPADITTLYGFKPERMRLEIGFGGGEHLIHRALEAPKTAFIGVEPFVNSMAKLIGRVEAIGPEIMAVAGGAGTTVGSGGMITKIKAARVLMVAGIPLVVCDGHRPEAIVDAAAGSKLTREKLMDLTILPDSSAMSSSMSSGMSGMSGMDSSMSSSMGSMGGMSSMSSGMSGSSASAGLSQLTGGDSQDEADAKIVALEAAIKEITVAAE